MNDDLQQTARRIRLVMGAMALCFAVVGGLALWGMWSSLWTEPPPREPVALPTDASLPPPVRDLSGALRALGEGGLLADSVEEAAEVLLAARLAGCVEVTILQQGRSMMPTKWVEVTDGLGWGSQSAQLRAHNVLQPRFAALLGYTAPDAKAVMGRLGRPDERRREPIFESRGGAIFPGGPAFSEQRQVKVGEFDVLTYDAGLVLEVHDGKVTQTRIDLSSLGDEQDVRERLVGRWVIDRERYAAVVGELLTLAPEERWTEERRALTDHADEFELILELRADGTGRAQWSDLTWMSHPHGFQIGWEHGARGESEFHWSTGPGGVRLVMPLGGGIGNRVVALAFVEDQLSIDTRHPRELRLIRESENGNGQGGI